MLKLEHIYKNYYLDKQSALTALSDINLDFEENEFVAILGPSGCGKTTLLNIIGGLDRYTSGDLIVDDISTKNFADRDWDAYRNKRIGTIFQSYNLISHLTVLGNVELALTLSGVSMKERKARAIEALESVGLKGEANKHPNQLSGGQMQRVAIARAIVNNPGVILADEPTGALDSKTSVQVMDILKSLSKSRLIIMVTHNEDLALQYATRIVRIRDGVILSDEKVVKPEGQAEISKETTVEINAPDLTLVDRKLAAEIQSKANKKKDKTAMGFETALNISSRNLWTKKGRTALTSIAGSFGIIGIALVLALSNGFKNYISRMETETLAQFPVSVEKYALPDMTSLSISNPDDKYVSYPSDENIIIEQPANTVLHTNSIDDEYIAYLDKMDESLYNSINKTHSIRLNVITEASNGEMLTIRTTPRSLMSSLTSTSYWAELPDSQEFVLSQYDLIGQNSRFPANSNEVVLVVDKYNRVSSTLFTSLGFDGTETSTTINDVIGKTYKMLSNDELYVKSGSNTVTNSMFMKESVDLNDFIDLYGEYMENPTDELQQQLIACFEYKATAQLDTYYENGNTVKRDLYDNPEAGEEIKIVGVLRPKATTSVVLLNPGTVYYTSALVDKALESNANSAIAQSFKKNLTINMSSLTPVAYSLWGNSTMTINDYLSQRLAIGTDTFTTSITIYPKSFNEKKAILNYLDAYNEGRDDSDKVIYTDLAAVLTSSIGVMVDIISYVLIAFAAISLVVSSVMIAIITYVSVIERTKEIGILRSIGARKKDVSRLFKAETFVIGAIAGTLGVLVSYLLCIPVNVILNSLFPEVEIGNIASLNPLAALALIAISIILTFFSGWIPSRMAAKKDPVVCLRSE